MTRWLLWLSALLTVAANKRITVIDMDMEHMRETINRFESMIVLMHDGSKETLTFQPWLYAIAQAVPTIRIGIINLVGTGAAITHTFRMRSLPAIKIFNRDEVGHPEFAHSHALPTMCALTELRCRPFLRGGRTLASGSSTTRVHSSMSRC